MANEAVLKYLVETNRPYSCVDVTANLRGAFTKAAIQRALDSLSEKGQIKCKVYGKQKVYVALQQSNNEVEEDNNTDDLNKQIAELIKNLEEKNIKLKSLENELKVLTSQPTNIEAQAQIDEITARIRLFEGKLIKLRESTNIVSKQERQYTMAEHEKYLKEYRKRKRMCLEIIDAVLDEYPKSKKCFLEELCIETDEDVGFNINCL